LASFKWSAGISSRRLILVSLVRAHVGHPKSHPSDIGLDTKDIPDQDKMVLQADIMYKSNWQQGTLKGMSFDVE